MTHILSFTLLPTLTFLLLSRTNKKFKSEKVSWVRIQWIRMNDFQPLHHGHKIAVQENFPTKFFVHATAKILCRTRKLEKIQNLQGLGNITMHYKDSLLVPSLFLADSVGPPFHTFPSV